MYYNKNRRYFENKKVVYYIGLALLITAVVLFVMPFTIDLRLISIIIIPTLICGCVLFFGSVMRRSSEAEIDEDVEKELYDFDEKIRKNFDLFENELPYASTTVMEGYHYFDTPYFRRDSHGVYRTDHYMKNVVYFTYTGLCIASRTVHLVDEGTEDAFYSIAYTDITDAKLEQNSKTYNTGKTEKTVRFYDFNIYGKDGVLFSCQTNLDYAVECATEEIKRLAEKSKQ